MWRSPQSLSGTAFCAQKAATRCFNKAATLSAAPTTAPKTAEPPKKSPPLPPPPPPKKSGGGAFVKLLGATLVGAGGAVGYAYYDEQFRKQVEKNVPYSKEAFDALFGTQEKPSVPKKPAADRPALARTIKVPEPIIEPPKPIEKPVESKPAVVPAPKLEPPKPSAAEKKMAAAAEAKKAEELKKADAEEKKRQDKERVAQRLREKDAEEELENAALEVILDETMQQMSVMVEKVTEAERDCNQAIRAHTLKVKAAMDNEEGNNQDGQWESVSAAYETKMAAIKQLDELKLNTEEAIEKLKHAVQEGKKNAVTKKNNRLRAAEEAINKKSYEFKLVMAEQAKTISESKVMEEYQDLVKKGKAQFRKEIEAIMPDVRIGNRLAGRMTEEELNSLIAHAHRRIEQLQKQLARQLALEEQHTGEALSAQKAELDKLQKQKVLLELEKIKGQFALEKQNWDTEAGVEFERELRHQLTRQAAAHSDHLADVLKVQEGELHRKYELVFTDKLRDETNKVRGEVADSITRLRGIEAAIDGRAEMEARGRKAQELWLACQTLYNTVLVGRDNKNIDDWAENQKPLADDVAAIKAAGDEHPFVNAMLGSIPTEAVTRGVFTEEAMQDRFDTVRRVCRRVAMIDETGGTLMRYFLSYLQSMFVFSKSRPYKMDEEISTSSLDTFKILDNAQYSLKRGDLVQALRFMNQLQGEPRKVTADWVADLRCLLETKQAADALLAHASAAGLGNLF